MRQRGFSLLEILVAVAIFTVISGAVFGLLNVAQQRYRMENEFMESFQGARLAMDQITRDVHSAGYPPANSFQPGIGAANPQLVAVPFAWPQGSGYPGAPCLVNGGCPINGGPAINDLIIEGNIDPENGTSVEWVRYQLNRTTLMRAVATKVAGGDPETTTRALLTAYVDNVMNNTSAAEMAQIQQFYPTMFPGGAPIPIFTYRTEAGTGPANIREVEITLIVRAANPDPRNRQLRVVTLTGRARRMNPSQ